jgi:hypothetical protein
MEGPAGPNDVGPWTPEWRPRDDSPVTQPYRLPPVETELSYALTPAEPYVEEPAPKIRLPGEDRSPLKAQYLWVPSQSLQGRPEKLAISGAQIDLGFPVRIEPGEIWLALGGVERLAIDTPALLPDSGSPIPDELWDVQVGVMHIRDLNNGGKAGGMVRVGSPSDEPFGATRDVTVSLLGFLTIPHQERDAWSFSLFYSPTGQVAFPLPGVAYVWRPSDQFQANLGVPFSLDYRPNDALTFSANYMPVNNVEIIARQKLGDAWSLYTGYRTMTEAFLLTERVRDEDRFYVFDQRFSLGVQRQLPGGWTLDASTAYLFDRRIFQAEGFFDDRRDELKIDSGLGGFLQLFWTR